MGNKEYLNKELALTISYLPAIKGNNGEVVESSIKANTELLENELMIEVSPDRIYDWELDQVVNSENFQINLRGTKKAFLELGKLLITVAHYADEDPDYHIHLDPIRNDNGERRTNLIVHAPKQNVK